VTTRTGSDVGDAVLADRLFVDSPDGITLRIASFPEDAITPHALIAHLAHQPANRVLDLVIILAALPMFLPVALVVARPSASTPPAGSCSSRIGPPKSCPSSET
jgi:hypothetical protein